MSKIALITGASSGMGKAAALRLSQEGFTIVAAARREDRLMALTDEIKQGGGECLPVKTDVGNLKEIQSLVQNTVLKYERIDLLFNNAGMMNAAPIEQLPHEDIEQMININVLAAIRIVKEVVPVMKKQNNGLILNVSSVLGRKTRANAWVYAASKWAITAMNDGLREELVGTRIRVCSLQPGVVNTELFDRFPEHPAKWQNISEMIKPEEMADLIAYIVNLPWHLNINEVLIRPTEQIV